MASVRVGMIGRPHGLDGSFYVLDPRPELLEVGVELELDGRVVGIERRAGTADRPILRLAGCATREQAAALRGSELRRSDVELPALGPDEWWAEELEGATVVDGERTVGVVSRLLGLPSCECLEVARDAGGTALLVPLVRDAIRSVDVAAKRIDVDLRFLGEA